MSIRAACTLAMDFPTAGTGSAWQGRVPYLEKCFPCHPRSVDGEYTNTPCFGHSPLAGAAKFTEKNTEVAQNE